MKKSVCFLLILIGSIVIIIDHFIKPTVNGWLGVILLCLSLVIIIIGLIKLLNKVNINRSFKKIIAILCFLFLLWFTALSIDFKRHCLVYEPIFSHLGYEVKIDYDMNLETGEIYEKTSTFYLFGIKIHVSGWIS